MVVSGVTVSGVDDIASLTLTAFILSHRGAFSTKRSLRAPVARPGARRGEHARLDGLQELVLDGGHGRSLAAGLLAAREIREIRDRRGRGRQARGQFVLAAVAR